ncbi:hypothetical protein BX600DRAFT_444931 [Xylariales sp. PMI_506]|nr:hypothetical protein BX600DRAFT_444931 [Xylariales sp. PMI_506]
MAVSDVDSADRTPNKTLHVSDRAALQTAWGNLSHPLLIHINADTTWLISLPYPPTADRPDGRARYNVLLDPWLQGPQSDVASWFSTQWHVVAPSVQTIRELNDLLGEVETSPVSALGADKETPGPTPTPKSYIDVVAISHEFTDHCHEATLKELPRDTPVFAADKAAALIKSWKHFNNVITTPGFASTTQDWKKTLSVSPLPPWVGIGRVITAGNALYYHSAVMVAFTQSSSSSSSSSSTTPSDDATIAQAVIYSPHGIQGSDLAPVKSAGIQTLALLHGLHDVRIWMTKQLNLGALNGLEAVRATGAKYWIATHDEVKRGGGFISPLLRRTRYTVADAVERETKSLGARAPHYTFVELGSGNALVLE